MSDADFCGSRRRRRGGSDWNPTGLFTNGEQGAWYDPSDLSTMFQDAAGTTAVTAVEQPVSLMLDKRLGGLNAIGPELIANGDFSGGTTGWASYATLGTASIAVVSGELQVTTSLSSNNSGARQVLTGLTTGAWYRVSVNARVISSGSGQVVAASIRWANGDVTSGFTTIAAATVNSVTALSGYFLATGTSATIALASGGNGTTSSTYVMGYDDVSVKLVPGNHAYTPSSASTSRPVLSARVNLLERTEEFDNAYWTKTQSSITQNAVTAPDGTLTADKLVENTATASHSANRNVTVSSGVSYTYSVYVKAAERGFCQVRYENAGSTVLWAANVNLSNGTFTTSTFGSPTGTSASVTAVGNGWYQVAIGVTTNTTTFSCIVFSQAAQGTNSYTGDGTSGIYLWGADLRVTNDGIGLPVYQRVTTSTDYDTTGFPLYLRADGSDDYMLTPSIDFSATDKMTVVAGVRKLSAAAEGCAVELSASSSANNGSFSLFAPGTASGAFAGKYFWASRGTVRTIADVANYAEPITNVVTGLGNIAGDSTVLRVNGAEVASNTGDQGSGNYGNYPLYLFRRGGSTVPFNGRFYGLVVRGAATDAATLQQTESFLNSRTRAY